MCSNYIPAPENKLAYYFGVQLPDNQINQKAYPRYLAPIVRLNHAAPSQLECVPACFGMVPTWAKMKLAKHTYIARSETVRTNRRFAMPGASSTSPSFPPMRSTSRTTRPTRLCAGGSKRQAMIRWASAGIWECRSHDPDGQPFISFSMQTVNADDHPLMKRFHKPEDEKRMVVILRPDEYASWLRAPADQLFGFLQQYPSDTLHAESAPQPSASRAGKGESASKSFFNPTPESRASA